MDWIELAWLGALDHWRAGGMAGGLSCASVMSWPYLVLAAGGHTWYRKTHGESEHGKASCSTTWHDTHTKIG